MNTRFLARLRVGLLSALFLFSSLALSFTPFLSSQVNASSPYDDPLYTETLDWTISGTPCDLTYSWFTEMLEDYSGTKVLEDFITEDYYWGVIRHGVSGSTASYSFFSIKTTVMDSGIGGGTFGYWANNSANKTYGIPFDFDVMFDANHSTNYAYVDVSVNSSCESTTSADFSSPFDDRFFGPGWTDDWAIITYNVFTGSNYIFFSNLPFIPPSGYEGEDPPSSPPVLLENFVPQIGYNTTTENKVQGIFLGTPECAPVGLTETTGCVAGYYLRWTVLGPDGTTILDQKTYPKYQPYEFQLPGNDDYTLTVDTVGPSPPGAPLSPDYNFLKLVFPIVADGSFLVGSTVINTCAVDGDEYSCDPADPLEDCSTYGTDVGGYFQCVINNFGTWLRSTMINLFVPSYSFFAGYQTEIGEFLDSKLGFVSTSVVVIVDLFGNIVTSAAITTCLVTPPGEFFGEPVQFDVCTFEDIYPAGFTVIQTLLIGITVVALFFAGLRKYHEVVDKR